MKMKYLVIFLLFAGPVYAQDPFECDYRDLIPDPEKVQEAFDAAGTGAAILETGNGPRLFRERLARLNEIMVEQDRLAKEACKQGRLGYEKYMQKLRTRGQ